MFVGDADRLAEVDALILGFREGVGDDFYLRFQRHLSSQEADRPELAVPSLIVKRLYPSRQSWNPRDLDPADGRRAVESLFDLLDSFLESEGYAP